MNIPRHNQTGAVLIVALVILAVTTLLGVAVMQGATMESKMVTSNQERQQAFNAAEAALRQAEQVISTSGFSNSDLRGCSDSTCFNTTCNNGLCFTGEFDTGDAQIDCTTFTGTVPPTTGVWENSAVWDNAVSVDLSGYPSGVIPGKYIIEFRCFTDQIGATAGTGGLVDDGFSGSGDVVYRITARGTSRSGRIDAMVQSTYRAAAP